VAPALDGGATAAIVFADAMDFIASGRFLFYDALNRISFPGGQVELWSIYALDLVTEQTLIIVPPTPGLVIGFPALSQASENFITFELTDNPALGSTIIAGNLNTGGIAQVGSVAGGFGVPGYNGDDTAIVYSQGDSNVPTGFSLVRQALANDRITPVGQPTPWLQDADFGVIYRRGSFTGPPEINLTIDQSDDADPVALGRNITYAARIENRGADAASGIAVTNTMAENVNFVAASVAPGGSCSRSGRTVRCELAQLASNGTATVSVVVTPTTVGTISNAANVAAEQVDMDTVDNNAFEQTTVGGAGFIFSDGFE
jgi:uncharacterized repeat protein (TIGR01451 family)